MQAELKIPLSKKYELVQHRYIVTTLETVLKQIGLDPDDLIANLTITDYGECMRVSFTLPDYQFDPGDG